MKWKDLPKQQSETIQYIHHHCKPLQKRVTKSRRPQTAFDINLICITIEGSHMKFLSLPMHNSEKIIIYLTGPGSLIFENVTMSKTVSIVQISYLVLNIGRCTKPNVTCCLGLMFVVLALLMNTNLINLILLQSRIHTYIGIEYIIATYS